MSPECTDKGVQLCGVTKGVDEMINGALWWFDHAERMKNDVIAKRAYVGECAGSHLLGRLRKRCIDTVKDCLRKRVDLGNVLELIGK